MSLTTQAVLYKIFVLQCFYLIFMVHNEDTDQCNQRIIVKTISIVILQDNIAEMCEEEQILSSMVHSPRTPRTPRSTLLVCRTPHSTRGTSRQPPSTLPRSHRMPSQTPLPRVALLRPAKRGSPYTSTTSRINTTTRTPRINTTTATTPSNIVTSRHTLLRNASSTVASTRNMTSSMARHASLYKTSPGMRRDVGSGAISSQAASTQQRRSGRLNAPNKQAPSLSTPVRNKLHFLI